VVANTPPGPGVDASGQAVVDPTANVLQLVYAETKRQDDLREYGDRCTREVIELRAHYDEKLRVSESARIDAIRAVDVGAAAILANQVAASAEALRGQVEAARQQTALSLAAALEPIQKDIADLRRVQYEQAGVKSAGSEDRSNRNDNRNIMVGLLGTAILAATIISPHIH
jgi:hypothetical protein